MLLIGEDNKTFTELWESGEYNVDPDQNFTRWEVEQLYDNREFRADILPHWGNLTQVNPDTLGKPYTGKSCHTGGNLTQVNPVTLGKTLHRYFLSHCKKL